MEKIRLFKKMRLSILAALVLAVVAVVAIPLWPKMSMGKAGGTSIYPLRPYYPLAEGITWNYLQTYAGGSKNYEVYCIGGTEVVNGESTDKQWNFDSGNFEEGEPDYDYSCLAWTKEGLKEYKRVCSDGSYDTYDPPRIQLPHLIHVGETFSHTTTITEYDAGGNPTGSETLSMELTLVAEEDVEVLAGSFARCLKFSGTTSDQYSQDGFTLWLVPGIGEVKFVNSEFDRELISYTEPGTTYCPGG